MTIAAAGGQPITMIDAAGDPIAVPSDLNVGGNAFSITRVAPVAAGR